MQRLVGLVGEVSIDRNQVARTRHLARDDDLVLSQAGLECELGRLDRRNHHALVEDVFRTAAELQVGVLLHLRDDQILIE